jgi:siroheme synthase-like protein
MPGYPIELDLKGRKALVVGLGRVGRRKAEGLRKANASVIGVDPAPIEPPEGVPVQRESYRAEHLNGIALAFATATPEVNRQVVADAKKAGVWVCSASEPDTGDFITPAVWREGGLTLTVSTAGASPALAAGLRDRAANALGPSASGLVAVLTELRPQIFARVANPELRRQILASWADPLWLEFYASAGPDAVRAEVLRALEPQEENEGAEEWVGS